MFPELGPGPSNSLVDVAGLRVGHHHRTGDGFLTGTTVVLTPPEGAVAGVDVRGGGPGTRETDLLDARNLVERVHAVTLCGGSAFGLSAADGVMRHLLDVGVGFPMGDPAAGEVVPIVPAAVIFDLGRGGDFRALPDASFGLAACRDASGAPPVLGGVGAGTGAQLAGGLKGGVGSASAVLPDGSTVAALVVVNAVGSPVDPRTGELWAAPHLLPEDLDGLPGVPPGASLVPPPPEELADARRRAAARSAGGGGPRTLATTIGVVATDAALTPALSGRLAMAAHDGLARAVLPAHLMHDGDTFFGLSTAARPAPDLPAVEILLHAAAQVVTRAIARGVLAAGSVTTPGGTWRSYRDAFPGALAVGPSP